MGSGILNIQGYGQYEDNTRGVIGVRGSRQVRRARATSIMIKPLQYCGKVFGGRDAN